MWIETEFKLYEESYKDLTGLHEWLLWVFNVEWIGYGRRHW